MARARTRQLYLPSGRILQDKIEQDLDTNDWDEALELLVCLDTLGISNEAHALAQQCVELLRARLGATFPSRTRKLDPVADAWEAVEALISQHPDLQNDVLIRRLKASWHKRFALLLDKGQLGRVFRGQPAGWHHRQAGQLALAETSLSATVDRTPGEAAYWHLLAQTRTQLQHDKALGAWFALMLLSPTSLPLPDSPEWEALPDGIKALYAEAEALALMGDVRGWLPGLGLSDKTFTWDMVPGKPIWDGNGTPKSLAGTPGAFLSFLSMYEKARKSSGGQRWQVAEARRSLQRLAPSLFEKYFVQSNQ